MSSYSTAPFPEALFINWRLLFLAALTKGPTPLILSAGAGAR